ncbi:MAG TPA: hypothetical protein VFR33_14350 [Candidatus Dormibacteraeota bacterium]|nr:hypothetical protein [Candidatus Dormibacteraeota bacterium]
MTVTGIEELEPTPLEDWIVPDELDEVDEVDDVDELELEEFDAVAGAAAVPGIVWALTTARIPTPRAAAIELPTVSRCRSRRPSSRARERARIVFVGSMGVSLR